ncbi:uncharacterized protein F5147DRAFT_816263 [Suillus discolor]|uniref:Clathrin/coatomer adaptor adaptin-like N-terminal domain-containing protein n=1 Tax=Suillus discolor TaxID=1912936 RepID=A0A9P7EYA8_9AGAM|nr:uncharacterized protein F5147DRAFT_816263 [Suillus discolor]KAG2097991.1 hypothetical protein F5147DRAFT_816263 [Suillus discolor]
MTNFSRRVASYYQLLTSELCLLCRVTPFQNYAITSQKQWAAACSSGFDDDWFHIGSPGRDLHQIRYTKRLVASWNLDRDGIENAIFAIYTIYREYEHLIPDAPELMQTFIDAESDATCKRNAFVFLAHCTIPKATERLISMFIELDCKNGTTHRPRYIRCMFELLNSSSHAVKYEAATTFTTLTQNFAAVKVASCFINLVIKESDNNIKLIVLDRLDTLHSKHGHILDGLTMDILQTGKIYGIGQFPDDVGAKLSQMILDNVFHGVLDQGRGRLIIFDELKVDNMYGAAIETLVPGVN